MLVKFIIAQFMLNKKKDQNATGKAGRQTEDIDRRKDPVSAEISPGGQ